jgi:hypothetical protein
MIVSVVRFSTQVPPWRTGEEASFPPALADEYVRRNLATMVRANVPDVDPTVAKHDAEERARQLSYMV